jgi:hypothetical protein
VGLIECPEDLPREITTGKSRDARAFAVRPARARAANSGMLTRVYRALVAVPASAIIRWGYRAPLGLVVRPLSQRCCQVDAPNHNRSYPVNRLTPQHLVVAPLNLTTPLPMPLARCASARWLSAASWARARNGAQPLVDRRRRQAGTGELAAVALDGRLVEANCGGLARVPGEKIVQRPRVAQLAGGGQHCDEALNVRPISSHDRSTGGG